MSSSQQINRALKRAEVRDRKRQTRMKVSGSSVKTLARLMNKRDK